ncbi:hypothetical protein PYW08_008303 [Mythimna loreyi]|uniref:Uncharacterized protein n=1 Tax=Mythimna loreyi TaxID=667449 RepID=A0ACC2QAZ7_9NEOP|nr:hypothetical protein PYW08_008303 [Mythimna loreyi]
MDLLNIVRVSVVIISMVAASHLVDQMTDKQVSRLHHDQVKLLNKDPRQGEVMCTRLAKEPYFGVEMLVGPTWRIYYSWNMDLQNQCLDMVFRNATPQVVRRIFNDMNEYLETEPYWDAATVLVSMGRARHEMLLFADQGAAGRFQGVPNVIRDGSITPARKTVPLLQFHLKLMYGGKYLLMADCQIGVTTLSVRRRSVPYRAEIGGIADSLDFGAGLHACQSDKRKEEGVATKQ